MSAAVSQREFDLVVIGGGSGGVRAARVAAQHGAKVLLAEESRLGGTCVIRGCVPKKLFVFASRYAYDLEDMTGFGWRVKDAEFDWPTLVANKDKEIARLEGVYKKVLETAGVNAVNSRAVVVDPHTVRLLATGEEVKARYILIAVGGQPARGPAIPGGELAITSNEAFSLPSLPKRILVQGAGYIGIEFATLFRGLGAEVSLTYRGHAVLRGFDEDVRQHVDAELTANGIRLLPGVSVTAIEAVEGGKRAILSDGNSVEVDEVMMAIGRVPYSANVGLEAVGVKLDKVGAVVVDAQSRSSVPSIYAVGDVTNRINLTPVAIREGHAFADTVFGNNPWVMDHSKVPTAVFCQPEIGTMGMSEAAAREAGRKVDIYRTIFRPMKSHMAGREYRVFMKLVVDAENDRVLGVHIVGESSGEMIQMIGIALGMGATKADFDRTVAVHPTLGEELVTMRNKVE